MISAAVASRIKQFAEEGGTVLLNEEIKSSTGLLNAKSNDLLVDKINESIFASSKSRQNDVIRIGKGKVIVGPYIKGSFSSLGLQPDFIATNDEGERIRNIAWAHRTGNGADIYFISNQKDSAQVVDLSLRVDGKVPEIWNPVTGEINSAKTWQIKNGRTELPVSLDKNASLFVVLQRPTQQTQNHAGKNWVETKAIQIINNPWTVQFDATYGGQGKAITWNRLSDWSQNEDSSIRYYSGTAVYTNTFTYHASTNKKPVWLNVGTVYNLAEVFVNGMDCGIAWTAPYRVDISKALKEGANTIKIEVVNTWNNRLVGDSHLPKEKRVTNTMYPFKMEGKPLLPAGLLGPVLLETAQ
jgi:hypothetical protein